MLEEHHLQDAYGFRHQPGVVICPRALYCVFVAFLPFQGTSKKQLRQLQEFFIVASWQKMDVVGFQALVDEEAATEG